jgi:hypothetical protein
MDNIGFDASVYDSECIFKSEPVLGAPYEYILPSLAQMASFHGMIISNQGTLWENYGPELKLPETKGRGTVLPSDRSSP